MRAMRPAWAVLLPGSATSLVRHRRSLASARRRGVVAACPSPSSSDLTFRSLFVVFFLYLELLRRRRGVAAASTRRRRGVVARRRLFVYRSVVASSYTFLSLLVAPAVRDDAAARMSNGRTDSSSDVSPARSGPAFASVPSTARRAPPRRRCCRRAVAVFTAQRQQSASVPARRSPLGSWSIFAARPRDAPRVSLPPDGAARRT